MVRALLFEPRDQLPGDVTATIAAWEEALVCGYRYARYPQIAQRVAIIGSQISPEPRSDNSSHDQTDKRARSCRRPGALHQLDLSVARAASSNAGATLDKDNVPRCPACCEHGLIRQDDEWALRFPFAASARTNLSNVRSDTAFRSRLFFLEALQYSELVGSHTAILLAPAKIGLFGRCDPRESHLPEPCLARQATYPAAASWRSLPACVSS